MTLAVEALLNNNSLCISRSPADLNFKTLSSYFWKFVAYLGLYSVKPLMNEYRLIDYTSDIQFLLLNEAIASRAVFVIVSGSDRRTETLLESAK